MKIWACFYSKSREDRIKHNLGIQIGLVVKTGIGYHSNGFTKVEFTVKSKKFYCFEDDNLSSMYNKYLFVAYDTSNPESSRLLYKESCFKKFGLPIPDSIVMNVPPKESPFSNQ